MKRNKEQIHKNAKQALKDRCKNPPTFEKPTMFSFKPHSFEELVIDCLCRARNRLFAKCTTLPVPEPRSGHRIVCDDGNMYSFGGYLETAQSTNWPDHLVHGTQRLFQELWCLNFAEGQWKILPSLGNAPKELASHSAVLHGNHLLVYGGTGVPFGGCSSNKINLCDLRTLEWKCLDVSGDSPIPQYGQAVVLDRKNKQFYVIGGTTGYNYSMDVHKLNMVTFEWERLFVSTGDTDEPKARYRHEVAFDGSKIYILGGGTATEAYDLKEVSAFDVQTRRWTNIVTTPFHEKYPCARKCQGSVQLDHEVYICGGYDSRKIFFDVWKLDLHTMSWTELTVRMPVPLYFHSTSVTNAGCMYIFGGVTDISKNTRTNKVFKVWLKVPKLKEICWEAMLHYKKDIKTSSHAKLLAQGIPLEFVNRVHPAPPCGAGEDTHEKWTSELAKQPGDKASTSVYSHGTPLAISY